MFYLYLVYLKYTFNLIISFPSTHELPFGIPCSSCCSRINKDPVKQSELSPIMTHLSAPWDPKVPEALWVPGVLSHQHAQRSRCHLGVREDQRDQVCLAVRPLQTQVSSDWQPTGPAALKWQRPNALMSVNSPLLLAQLIFISFIHWFCSYTH